MRTSPNPAVVAAIAKRVEEWQRSKTEQVYQPIVDHYEAHRVAIQNMTKAIRAGDAEATKKYFDEAEYHEMMQRQAGIEARAYFLSKVQHTQVQA
jgi:hypothetical protein